MAVIQAGVILTTVKVAAEPADGQKAFRSNYILSVGSLA